MSHVTCHMSHVTCIIQAITPVLNYRACILDTRQDFTDKKDWSRVWSKRADFLSWLLLFLYTIFRFLLGVPLTVHIVRSLGFESGPHAQPCVPGWVRVADCSCIVISCLLNLTWYAAMCKKALMSLLHGSSPGDENREKKQ